MTTRTAVASLEMYRVTISTDPTSDPTSLPVALSFPLAGNAPTVWYNANWELQSPPYVAAILLGPDAEGSDLELAEGVYDVYAQIEDVSETPRFMVDRLVVFADTTIFGSVSELADVLRTDIDPEDPQANQALRDATNFVRDYTRQTLTFVEDDEVALDGRDRKGLLLPERPVVEVVSVTTVDNLGEETLLDPTAYRVDRADMLWRLDGWGWDWGHGNVAVIYSHGYTTLPDDLATATLEIAAHNYAGAAVTAGNVESERILSYEVTYGAVSNTSVSGSVSIPPAWKVILDRYRVSA